MPDQNPVPYRLATAQKSEALQGVRRVPAQAFDAVANGCDRGRQIRPSPSGNWLNTCSALAASGKAANTHAPVPVKRARPCLRQPCRRRGDFRVTAVDHRFAIVAASAHHEVGYCDRRGVSCQFRVS
jgi:hypothetical protein